MNATRFHFLMTRDMRRACASRIEQLVTEMKRIDRAMSTAENTGQPTNTLLDEFNHMRGMFCLAWVHYRRHSRLAAIWASKEKQRVAARGGRA